MSTQRNNEILVRDKYHDARIVYNWRNKPFVLSSKFLFESSPGNTIEEAWNKALEKILSKEDYYFIFLQQFYN